MAADGGESEVRAADRFRVESRPSTISLSKKVRTFVLNLFSAAVTGPATWPPVDVVLIDESTKGVVKTWHEGGEEASRLVTVLEEDLVGMSLDDFVEKWDVPTR